MSDRVKMNAEEAKAILLLLIAERDKYRRALENIQIIAEPDFGKCEDDMAEIRELAKKALKGGE